MNKISLVYYSSTGNTYSMAKAIEEGIIEAGGKVTVYKASEMNKDDILSSDVIAMGSPAMGAEVIDENSWINRQFKAREFNVSGNAKLESSRNVSLLEGNFNARHQAQIQLGFTQGKSSECIRASYTGYTACSENKTLGHLAFNSMPVTVVFGNIDLKKNSQLNLGKAHLVGRINAMPMTQIRLQPNSQWTLNGNSAVGNLDLLPRCRFVLS